MGNISKTASEAVALERLRKEMFSPLLGLELGVLAPLCIEPILKAMMAEQLAVQKAALPELKSVLAPTLDVSHSATRAIATMLDSVRINASVQALLGEETQKLRLAFGAARASALADWKGIFSGISAAQAGLALPLQTHLSVLFERSALAGGAFARVKEGSLGARLGLKEPDRAGLAEVQEEFEGGYRSFITEVASTDLGVLELPAQLTELPAAELVNQAALVVSTSETEDDADAVRLERAVADELALETTDDLTGLVAELDPDLIQPLKGAREAFVSRHTDYVRHFVTSYRELFTHVLHRLTPDDELRRWSKDPSHFHQGKPTRRARLLFITRDLLPSFGGFLTADVGAVLKFIDAFQRGTHEVKPAFTGDELQDLKNRTEGLLRFMLVTHRFTMAGRL